jgi:exosome complex RNA-binding protein Rrp42 (RNase PH superfamily)
LLISSASIALISGLANAKVPHLNNAQQNDWEYEQDECDEYYNARSEEEVGLVEVSGQDFERTLFIYFQAMFQLRVHNLTHSD